MPKCCLVPLLHLCLPVPCCILCAGILPFNAVDLLFSGWDFYSFGLFSVFPHQYVYKHVSHNLLGYLEMESRRGRVARERVIGICQLSLKGRKSQHLADPFL